MRTRLAALVCATLLALACKSRGTVSVALELPAECATADRVRPYLLRGVACSDCQCGDCLAACRADNCTVGCIDAVCPIDRLDDGVALRPPGAGAYAAVLAVYATSDAGVDHLVATACQDLEVAADGTTSQRIPAPALCCPAP